MQETIPDFVPSPTPPGEPTQQTESIAYLSREAEILRREVGYFGRLYKLSTLHMELAADKALAALMRNPPKPGYVWPQTLRYLKKIAETKTIDVWRQTTGRYCSLKELLRDPTVTIRQGTGHHGVSKFREPFAKLPLLPRHRDGERMVACEMLLGELGLNPGEAGWLLDQIVLNHRKVVDVARQLGITPKSVQKRLERAAKKAKKLYPRICAQRTENWGNLRHQIETMFAVRQGVQGYRRWLYRGKEHLPWPDKRQRAMPVLAKLRRLPRRPLVSRHWDQSVDAALEDSQVDNAPRKDDYEGEGELPMFMSKTRSIIKAAEDEAEDEAKRESKSY